MKNKIYVTPENDPRDYVGYDLVGFPFNKKYPPNKKYYGQSYEGYANKALGVLLYDYCVVGYDVEFSCKGKTYYLRYDGEGVITDSQFTKRIEVFDSPMNLVENFKIDGKTFLGIAQEIDDIDPI